MELYYDLHLHSCLSPCGSDDMTPANLAGMCMLAGLDVAALTDHNTVGNCRAFCRAAENLGLLALPGMELTTREEVHVVCLFPGLEEAEDFGALVYSRLPDRPNDAAIFGRQLQMNEYDELLGEEERMLAGASDVGVYEAAELAKSRGGIAYPAHVDRPSFSLLSNLGLWDPAMGFCLAELSRLGDPAKWGARSDLNGVPFITSSDAHYLHEVPDAAHQLNVEEATPQGIIDALYRLESVYKKN